MQELHTEEAGNLEIGLLLANTYGETEDYESMQQICTALAESEAKEPRLLYLSAKAAHALDKHEEALNFLDDAISERTDYAQAIQLRVQVLSTLARYDEALADAERLLKDASDHEDYALLQAETLAAAGLGQSYERCLHCGTQITGDAFFHVREGGALCANCRTEGATFFSEELRVLLVGLEGLDWAHPAPLQVRGGTLMAAESLVLSHVQELVGHPLRSLAFLSQLT